MTKHPIQKEAERIHLSVEEKTAVRNSLAALVSMRTVHGVRKQTYARYTNSRKVTLLSLLHNSLKPMAISLIIALLVSGGVSYAAEDALPGETLYPVKLEVNERVRGWAAVSEEAEAKWQTRAAERRLEEAETLASQNRLTADIRARIEANFKTHADRVEERILRFEASENTAAAVDVSSNFETSLRAHAAILERLGTDTEETVRAEVEPLILRIRARAAEAAEARQNVETRIAASSNTRIQAAAEGRLTAAENKIAEVRAFIGRADASAEVKAEAEAKLKRAEEAVADGKAKIEAEAYNEAFLLFQNAHRIAQEAKLILTASIRLPAHIDLNIRTQQRIETGAETESKAETNIRVQGSVKTETNQESTGTEAETRGNLRLDVGL